jgi:hypothetical protein
MRRSRFVFGDSDLTLSLSVKAWEPDAPTVGGRAVSGAGVPASFIVRRDHTLDVTLRVTEAEWDEVESLIAYGQASLPITWYPDADGNTSYQVYLESPAPGESVKPTRTDFPRVFERALTLRAVTGSVWQPFFA